MAASAFGMIAIVGLGNMGGEIARRLATRWEVLGYDTDPGKVSALSQSSPVRPAKRLSEVSGADVVVLSLPTRQASLNVVTQAVQVLRPGSVIVETSTVNPSDMLQFAELCEAAEVGIVDAAILAGVAQMRLGQAAVMAAGDPAVVDRVGPLIETMSEKWTRVGDLGHAMALKVIHNAVIHAVTVVLAESAALAHAAGADPEQLIEILKDPERGLLRPLTHRLAERIMHGQFDGGMPTEAALKDSVLALELAQASHVPLFGIQSAHTVYEAAVARGLGRLDYASIGRLWEEWGNFTFGAASRQ
jgi:3-hydroxyisobutyrate dehydrogenase-like beta-hydroxyacid dehydrogenase